MSTVYSDAAGNYYLGDCRFASHNINYPSTSFLKSVDSRIQETTFLGDMSSILSSAGWGNISVPANFPTSASSWLFSATPPGEASGNFFRLMGNSEDNHNVADIANTLKSTSQGNTLAGIKKTGFNFDYSVCVGSNSISFIPFFYNSDYTKLYSYFFADYDWSYFYYWGRLLNVNTNYNYYNATFASTCVVFSRLTRNPGLTLVDFNGTLEGSHFIAGAKKPLLKSGKAAYTISCSDGQTPGSQWATDLYVYDNNTTLGFPVIGRVPNLLLGIGSYTYLKPVKIQGSVFPDAGSPWYLPVGTFAGKTLLMRCYSSVT